MHIYSCQSLCRCCWMHLVLSSTRQLFLCPTFLPNYFPAHSSSVTCAHLPHFASCQVFCSFDVPHATTVHLNDVSVSCMHARIDVTSEISAWIWKVFIALLLSSKIFVYGNGLYFIGFWMWASVFIFFLQSQWYKGISHLPASSSALWWSNAGANNEDGTRYKTANMALLTQKYPKFNCELKKWVY